MKPILSLLALFTVSLAACAAEDDPATATTATQEGVVSGPTILKAGTSTATTSASARTSGLQMDGGKELGSYLLAQYAVTPRTGDSAANLTVTAAGDASFVYILRGSGPGYVGKQLRLQRVPGSPNLVAAAATGMVTCGAIAPDTSTLVTLVVHAMPPRTFDVLLDGAATACTGLATGLEPPFVGFEIMDPSNEGYGGRVTFDGLSL